VTPGGAGSTACSLCGAAVGDEYVEVETTPGGHATYHRDCFDEWLRENPEHGIPASVQDWLEDPSTVIDDPRVVFTDELPADAGLARRAWSWLRADWAKLDDPLASFFGALALAIGSWFLLVEGGNRILGAILLPFTLLAIYRFVRAVRTRRRA
jgi:hypothetical protein